MPPRYLLLLLFLLVFLVTIIQLEVLSIAFQKLGLSPRGALLLVLGVLFGSGVNIPLTTIKSTPPLRLPPDIPHWGRLWQPAAPRYTGKTILAINLGGCIIPVGISLHLLAKQLVNPFDLLPALLIVTAVSYVFSRPISGIGIGMPVFIAPLVAVITALFLEPAREYDPGVDLMDELTGVMSELGELEPLQLMPVEGERPPAPGVDERDEGDPRQVGPRVDADLDVMISV